MNKFFLFLTLFALLSACNKQDDQIVEDENFDLQEQRIKNFSYTDQNTNDSLFYNDGRLILRKEFIGDFLDYNHNYIYNSENKLIEINKIHSTVTFPIQRSTYTYYPDGNLKTRFFTGYNIEFTDLYTYASNLITINEGQASEIKIHLDAEGRIISAETLDANTQQHYTFITYEFDTNDNVIKITERFSSQEPFEEFHFQYDNKLNPFFIFDQQLPNGLSIKKLEAVTSHSNYPFISPGDSDNYAVYLSKNNFVSSARVPFTPYTYTYTYNDEGSPTKITYDFLGSNSALLIEYY